MEDGYKKNADHDHGQGDAKIILHKAHPVGIGLAGSGDKSDGAGLCADDAQEDQSPLHAAVGKEIAVEVVACTAFLHPVQDNSA